MSACLPACLSVCLSLGLLQWLLFSWLLFSSLSLSINVLSIYLFPRSPFPILSSHQPDIALFASSLSSFLPLTHCLTNFLCSPSIFPFLFFWGRCRVVDNLLARGAGGPEFTPRTPVMLTSLSLARQRRFLNEMYVMRHTACLPCRKFDFCNHTTSAIV